MVLKRASLFSRFILPAGLVLATMAATTLAYNLAWRLESHGLHQGIALVSGVLLFLSIGFGSLLVYPLAFFRGATAGERIVACLATPIFWNLKEIVRVSEFFTPAEALYYGLNSLFLVSVIGAFAQMGLCEMLCRWRLAKRGALEVKVVSALPVVSIALGLLALAVMLAWGEGVHWFYIYMEGYKALFL